MARFLDLFLILSMGIFSARRFKYLKLGLLKCQPNSQQAIVSEHCDAKNPLASSAGDKRLSYVKGCDRVNITSLTTLALNVYIFGNLYH